MLSEILLVLFGVFLFYFIFFFLLGGGGESRKWDSMAGCNATRVNLQRLEDASIGFQDWLGGSLERVKSAILQLEAAWC